MKIAYIILILLFPLTMLSQIASDSSNQFKKRVLDRTEIDILTSYYSQDGKNAAVTGGIGTEKLNDIASDINVSVPLNSDDILNLDFTISAYTSASSSNLNPFSGASESEGEDDRLFIRGTPWLASSGASKSDVWLNGIISYTHYSDDRNKIISTNINLANEYDYQSLGLGLSYARFFNSKNTELFFNLNTYFDNWLPQYPTEIITYIKTEGDLNDNFFERVEIYDQNQISIDKDGDKVWRPININLISTEKRNSYSISLRLSQILSKNTQFSIFSDLVYQSGWLANPMQRVYFADIDNYYIGYKKTIPNYTSSTNTDVFQLADDIERLPSSRLKIPVGIRLNNYINDRFIIKSYYRYYYDDWGIISNTFSLEIPVKLNDYFTLYPNYRYYNQTASFYFAPYEKLISTSKYYSSDYDLSKFNSNQYGLGINFTDVLVSKHLWKFGLKNINMNFSYYKRNTGLNAYIISLGTKFVIVKKNTNLDKVK